MATKKRTTRSSRKSRRSSRRRGNAKPSKQLLGFAADITNTVMRNNLITPYQLAQRFGLSVDVTGEILGLAAHAFGPGGAGSAWMMKKTAKIIGRK
jgi:ribosomal protein S25